MLLIFGSLTDLWCSISRYLETKEGKLPKDSKVNDIPLHCLSLYEVKSIGTPAQLDAFKLENQPIISSDKCDCKAFWSNGWLCSHILATAVLMKQFDLEKAMGVPTRKINGGQRKVPGALYKNDSNKTLSTHQLTKKLQEQPMYPRQ